MVKYSNNLLQWEWKNRFDSFEQPFVIAAPVDQLLAIIARFDVNWLLENLMVANIVNDGEGWIGPINDAQQIF